MKNTLVARLAKRGIITVDKPRTIDFMSEEGRVYTQTAERLRRKATKLKEANR
jgi:hypothetical protein